MINSPSLIHEIQWEEAKEAIKGMNRIKEYCSTTQCSSCVFYRNETCYLVSEHIEVPSDWDMYDLTTN